MSTLDWLVQRAIIPHASKWKCSVAAMGWLVWVLDAQQSAFLKAVEGRVPFGLRTYLENVL